MYTVISGDGYMGFNNAVFLSERETADRNYSMAYYLKENRCFPPKTNLANIMDLYFQVRVVHKLRCQDFGFFFDHLPFFVYNFYLIKVDMFWLPT